VRMTGKTNGTKPKTPEIESLCVLVGSKFQWETIKSSYTIPCQGLSLNPVSLRPYGR